MNRRKKKKIRSARLSKIILVVFPVIIVLVIYLFSKINFFTIKEIEVKGDDLICANQNQLKNSNTFYGINFFLLDKQKIIDELKEKFICIKNINLSRLFPDKIKMEVVSRKPTAILITLNDQQSSPSALIEGNIATSSAEDIKDSFLVDDEGVVFSKTTDELNIPKIYTYNSTIAVGQKLENIISDTLRILNKSINLGIEIKKSWIIDNFYIVQAENQGSKNPLKIIFQLNKKVDMQLASLQLILAEAKINRRTVSPEPGTDFGDLEFIDLRFDKPIIKLTPKNSSYGKR